MSTWIQPAPTKRFAVFYDGAWYGQGDTAEAAWWDAKRQTNASHCRYGAALYAKIRRAGTVRETVAA